MPSALVVGRRMAAVTGMIVLAMAWSRATASAQEAPPSSRVRAVGSAVVAAIAEGIERSTTFRHLVESIDMTDGLVYVQHGDCKRRVLACLHLSVVVSGRNRILRVLVSPRIARDCERTSLIGHELQHALEVLSNPQIRNWRQMFFYFQQIGSTSSGAFETDAAIWIGVRVEEEACARR